MIALLVVFAHCLYKHFFCGFFIIFWGYFSAVTWLKYCRYGVKLYYNQSINQSINYYRSPGGGRLFDMKAVSSYVFLRTYYV